MRTLPAVQPYVPLCAFVCTPRVLVPQPQPYAHSTVRGRVRRQEQAGQPRAVQGQGSTAHCHPQGSQRRAESPHLAGALLVHSHVLFWRRSGYGVWRLSVRVSPIGSHVYSDCPSPHGVPSDAVEFHPLRACDVCVALQGVRHRLAAMLAADPSSAPRVQELERSLLRGAPPLPVPRGASSPLLSELNLHYACTLCWGVFGCGGPCRPPHRWLLCVLHGAFVVSGCALSCMPRAGGGHHGRLGNRIHCQE
jgi:hypothetical protein